MRNGLKRYLFYAQQLELLLNKARDEKDPAMWLFKNNARTTFFMLEGLSRLYSKMHNPKTFGKLKQQFKLAEDGFGQIDFYFSLTEAFADNKRIPADYKEYFKRRLVESATRINGLLEEKEWLSADNIRIKKIIKKLKKADWLKHTEEVEAISQIYRSTVSGITNSVDETSFRFDNVEEDVHELRRRLRWLSIYPQALQGAIQFSPDIKTATHLEKYLTKEIINSPYNKLPPAGNNTSLFLLQRNYFLALSWLIAQLGNLKDEGLILTALCEATKQGNTGNEEEILSKAETLMGNKQPRMKSILKQAENIVIKFFEEKNLQELIADR